MPLVVPMAVAGVLSIVRDDILSSAVSSGLSLLGSLQSSSSPELKASLEEMDVEAVLKTVEAVVNEVEADFNRPHAHAHAHAASSQSQLLPAATHTKPATATDASAEAGKELETGWVAVPKATDASAAAADAKQPPATATATATGNASKPAAATPAPVSAAAGVATKFTARKKSSLLHATGNGAVALAVDQIEDAVAKLHGVLVELDAESRAHSARYFAAWRSNGFAALLDRLRALQAVLDKRLDLLLKVLSVKSLTTQQLQWHSQHTHASTAAGATASSAAGLTAASAAASASAAVTSTATIAAATATAKAK